MRHAVCLVGLGLIFNILAAGADSTGCAASKGLYEDWLGTAKAVPRRTAGAKELIDNAPSGGSEPEKQQAAARKYQAFFVCLSDAVEHQTEEAVMELCRQAGEDRIASLVCHVAVYLMSGRTDRKEFLDALPSGKRGGEVIWDLDAIGGGRKEDAAPVFSPNGPAYKLMDELFLLVLDAEETAAAKYMSFAALASGDASRHMDEQMKLLIRESPAVIVKRWMVFRQYQPKLKRLLAEMSANLPAAEIQKLRRGLGAFCAKDNPDCPEIVRLFGKPE
jgi:hypothetical protein